MCLTQAPRLLYFLPCRYVNREDYDSCLKSSRPSFWTDTQLLALWKSAYYRMREHTSQGCYSTQTNEISTLIDVHKSWTKSDSGPQDSILIPFGVKFETESRGKEVLSKTGIKKLGLYFPYFRTETDKLTDDESKNQTIQFSVMITNRGVFDRTNTTDGSCHNEKLPSFRTCMEKRYALAMERECNCVPFMYTDLLPNSTLSICTSENYGSTCVEKVLRNMNGYSCEPCLTTQNEYKIDTTFGTKLFEHPEGWYRFQIGFTVRDQYYSSYEETTKNTMAQTIAQVGGDIGFYTGFSLFALWKFIVYIIHHYRSHKGELNKQGGPQNTNKIYQATRMIKSTLEITALFVSDGDSDEQQAKKERDFETRLTKQEKLIEQLVVEIRRLQTEIQKQKKKRAGI